jgi:hypothetical protein
MHTLTRPDDNPPVSDPQAATPYFRLRQLRFDRAVRDEMARRGLTPAA